MKYDGPTRRGDILAEVRRFMDEYGHGPTVRWLRARVGLASTSAVHYHIRRLIRTGELEYCPCGCRAIRTTGPSNVVRVSAADTTESVDRKMEAAFSGVAGILAEFDRYMS